MCERTTGRHGIGLSKQETLGRFGGQLEAGYVLTGFYEDGCGAKDRRSDYMATLIATRAVKP